MAKAKVVTVKMDKELTDFLAKKSREYQSSASAVVRKLVFDAMNDERRNTLKGTMFERD